MLGTIAAARSCSIRLASEAATEAFGRALAPALGPGDTLLLQGPLGAGKSALARAVIAARLGPQAGPIPSPSYTLVNVYRAKGAEIWHADLYRLSDASEIEELGLDDAWDRALVLVEWPERLGNDLPPRRLDMVLTPLERDERSLEVTPRGSGWDAVAAIVKDWT